MLTRNSRFVRSLPVLRAQSSPRRDPVSAPRLACSTAAVPTPRKTIVPEARSGSPVEPDYDCRRDAGLDDGVLQDEALVTRRFYSGSKRLLHRRASNTHADCVAHCVAYYPEASSTGSRQPQGRNGNFGRVARKPAVVVWRVEPFTPQLRKRDKGAHRQTRQRSDGAGAEKR